MKIVIVGATGLGARTAGKLIEAGHDVVVVDAEREKLDEIGDALDCGLLQGDGTHPSVLRNAAGDGADALLALTRHDETNILAALAARSLGYAKVAPKVDNHELGPVCLELGLEDAIFAEETLSSTLADQVQKRAAAMAELAVAEGWTLMRVAVGAEHAGPVEALNLPGRTRLLTRAAADGPADLCDAADEIAEGDRLVLLTHEDDAPAVRDRFADPRPSDAD
ncbi:MAG: NAD-binding protein [Pseudomonadota bacterium]